MNKCDNVENVNQRCYEGVIRYDSEYHEHYIKDKNGEIYNADVIKTISRFMNPTDELAIDIWNGDTASICITKTKENEVMMTITVTDRRARKHE
jgi:hypothetical protein